ncbi:MAG: hypothetical protein ACOH1V_02410 [Stenotrophomonas sp.]
MSAVPAQQSFPTGRRGETLVLMVCATWLWAGLYASPRSATPLEVSAVVGKRARTGRRELRVGIGRYAMTPRSLQRACRWLDRQGVTVREARA